MGGGGKGGGCYSNFTMKPQKFYAFMLYFHIENDIFPKTAIRKKCNRDIFWCTPVFFLILLFASTFANLFFFLACFLGHFTGCTAAFRKNVNAFKMQPTIEFVPSSNHQRQILAKLKTCQ
jgi:hypothetical protein